MIKSIVKLGVLGLIGVAIAGMPMQLQAQDMDKPSTEKAEPRRGNLPLHGKVKALDEKAKTITVGQTTVTITSDTKITKAGKTATLAEGSIGEEVTILYRRDDAGKATALMVRFGPREGKEAKAESAAN